ncbi:hypothetical protein TRVL_02858 [Trypanosoma vivax]|nr:hypothetical protein TRVL_02858 [Trypanosoma vivax]
MSEQEQSQELRGDAAQLSDSTKEGVLLEDKFTAMRQAALSMFKQRTKDLTMVSALTAEAQKVERLNTQVQSTTQKLHEQKALLEAQIETEERRLKEWEGQLHEVHTMLAQMKEDQGFFSGVQRASEKIVTTLQHFVTQYAAKGGEVSRLLERAQEATQGRAPMSGEQCTMNCAGVGQCCRSTYRGWNSIQCSPLGSWTWYSSGLAEVGGRALTVHKQLPCASRS